jgi:flagella basal body P-ring formation protein FlgA
MRRRFIAAVLAFAATVSTAVALASAATVAYTAPELPKSQSIAGSRMTAISDRIASQLVTDPDRSVAPAFSIADQIVPDGTVAIVAQKPIVNPTYIAVPIEIMVDGRLVRSVVAGYRVQQYIHTAVTTHDLSPGAVLTSDDLTMQRVLSNGRPGVDVGDLVGRKLRTALNRGSALYVEQTSVVELVKSGAGVILIVRDGPVALTADVIARTGGGLGDTVTVYNAKTSKILSGTVVGPDRVELDLPGENE